MNEKLAEALGYVNTVYVEEAARRKKKGKRFLGAVAAVLALVILFNTPFHMVITAKAVALPGDSRAPEWHGPDDRKNTHDTYEEYKAVRDADLAAVAAAMESMVPFFTEGSVQFLTGTDDNRLWSPVNAAIGLAMLAETADGTTRQELLDLLGVSDIETLRASIARVWEECNEEFYQGEKSIANSLWLDQRMKYDQSVMDTLAYDYYASVYRGKLGSSMTNYAIQTWVDNNTGGFLKSMSKGIDISPSPKAVATVMTLMSTVYLKGNWYEEFNPGKNTDGAFHSPAGDTMVTYMNKKTQEYYYWGESYGAITMGMKNDTSMWLILPDEDKTVTDVLAEGEYLKMLGNPYEYENSKYMKVNLSMPKFDISNELSLREGLQEMGLTEVFDESGGDFGTTFDTDLPIFVNEVKQASRVSVDELGVTAAAYIEINMNAGAAEPPEEIIDFVLDQPFIFVIASDSIPMFVGVVNEP